MRLFKRADPFAPRCWREAVLAEFEGFTGLNRPLCGGSITIHAAKHGLQADTMALITSDCGAMLLPEHRMALITSVWRRRWSRCGTRTSTSQSPRWCGQPLCLQLQSPWAIPPAAVCTAYSCNPALWIIPAAAVSLCRDGADSLSAYSCNPYG